MKLIPLTGAALTALTFALPAAAQEDSNSGFAMGAGQWTCARVLEVSGPEGTAFDKAQMVGWILGFWSAATFERDDAFDKLVRETGGLRIAELTAAQCQQSDPNTLLGALVRGMIRNTKAPE